MGTGNPVPTVAQTMDHLVHSTLLYQLHYLSHITLELTIKSNYFPLTITSEGTLILRALQLF